MKAIIYTAYGSTDVLKVAEVAEPTVGDDDVLVQIRAASVNPYDWHFMRGEPYFMRLMFGLRAPKVQRLGADYAGDVTAVGRNVGGIAAGDAVMGFHHGAFAEYACVKAAELAPKPTNLTFEEAATLPMAGLTALQGLRDEGKLQPGQRVLIIGASGGVGTFAVQIAKSVGAHVTGVCSPRNHEFVRALGADQVVDYANNELLETTVKYDLVLQLAGQLAASKCTHLLTPRGTLVLCSGDSDGRIIGPVSRILMALALSPFVSQRIRVLNTKRRGEDLRTLAQLVEAGSVKPVVDRVVSLSEVPQALAEVEKGHTRGKVVVRI